MDLPEIWVSANDGMWGPGEKPMTYRRMPYRAIPPVTIDDTFGWLASRDVPRDGMRLHEDSDPVDAPLNARLDEAAGAGLAIPPSFTTFMGDAGLRSRVPSCTSCYFDLGARLVPLPHQVGPDRLLRFMNDQQACFLWYLLLEPHGAHRIAVATPRWKDRKNAPGDPLEDCADPTEIHVCARSFDEFIKRVWIESTAWYARANGTPMDLELTAYCNAACVCA